MDNKIVSELQDMRYLSWAKIRNSSGTAGSFMKSYDEYGPVKRYYKLSNYVPGTGITGHECVNEIIVDRLLTILGIPHLEYRLIHALIEIGGNTTETYLCASDDFKQRGESKLALDAYYESERLSEKEGLLEFCVRNGWEDYIYPMLAADYLILNRDRHGANIEVLRNSARRTLRLAPLFDHGLSLVFGCVSREELDRFDVTGDLPVQCCVGGRSAYENLKLIPKDNLPALRPLTSSHRDVLMYALDGILPLPWQDKIWELIWKRWLIYESFCGEK